MISINLDVLAVIISFVTLLALIGGGFFWLGKLSNRVSNLESRVDQLADEMHETREEMRQRHNELLEAMQNQRSELLEAMRHGNQQLLLALVNHGHDDDGQPVFRVPVSAE